MAPLPEGWLGCPEVSVKLVDDLFFAFKTPLENYTNTSFTIQSVFNYAEQQNWKLGLWIDLTYTEKYFSRKTMEKWNVKYLKLAMEGRRSPTESQTAEFIKHCSEFIEKNPGSCIGVHCTHGFNRTGYLICSFLSHVKKYKPIEALTKFAEARPPGIYRQMMVNDFIKRYSTNSSSLDYWHVSHNVPWKEKGVPTTNTTNDFFTTPKKRISLVKTNPTKINGTVPNTNTHNSIDVSVGGGGVSSVKAKKKKKKPKKKTEQKGQNHEEKNLEETCRILKKNLLISFPMFLTKFPGVQKINDDVEKQEILQELQSLVEFPSTSSTSSAILEFQKEEHLTQENFSILQENHETYSVTWCPQEYYKYILFINSKHEVYLINTQNSVHRVPSLQFPNPENAKETLYSTILEGIVLRRRKSTVDNFGWFSLEITNVLAFQGQVVKDQSHKARQDCIQKSIISARVDVDNKQEPFTIQMKHMWTFRNLAKLQTFKWSSHYFCPPNGLIFYPHSSEKQVFYWRCPESVNAAHFRLFLEYPIETEASASSSSSSNTTDPRALLYIDEQEQPFSEISLETDQSFALTGLNGHIIECTVEKKQDDCNEKKWKFKREATKRMYSDSIELVTNVWDGTIEKNVKMSCLFVNFLLPKKRQRITTITTNDNLHAENKS